MSLKINNLNTYYKTSNGKCYCGDGLDLIKKIADNSVSLILTSPPFALTSQKEYGNKQEAEYINWFLKYTEQFKRVLKNDGSFVVDLGGAYLPGHPTRSIYQYELLCRLVKEQNYFLAQEFFHYNPARLPAPAQWVNVKRVRVKDSVNLVWWLSKTEMPKADNKKVLKPYSPAMVNLLKKGYKSKLRPSGHNISNKFSKNNQGSIPPNLLEMGNNESNSVYMQRSKELGLKPHPAKYPKKFAEFFIKFLTDDNDLVLDPFAGSNTTGFVAESLNRKWISFEINKEYFTNSAIRFEEIKSKIKFNNNGSTK